MAFVSLMSVNFTACSSSSSSDDGNGNNNQQEVKKTEEWVFKEIKYKALGQMGDVPYNTNCTEKDRVVFYSDNSTKSFIYSEKNNCEEQIKENTVKINGNNVTITFLQGEISGTFEKSANEVQVTVPITELEQFEEVINNPQFSQSLPYLISIGAEVIIYFNLK